MYLECPIYIYIIFIIVCLFIYLFHYYYAFIDNIYKSGHILFVRNMI